MSTGVAELRGTLHDPFHDSAGGLASRAGFCRRKRRLTGSAFAKALVFAPPDKPACSLEGFADSARQRPGVSVPRDAFGRRFGPRAVDSLAGLFARASNRCLSARPALLPLLRRLGGVPLRDATCAGLPGCLAGLFPGRPGRRGKPAACLKLLPGREVPAGPFAEAEAVAGLGNEKAAGIAAKPPPEGSQPLAARAPAEAAEQGRQRARRRSGAAGRSAGGGWGCAGGTPR